MWRNTGDRARERGAALLEAAIALPVFFLLVFGLIDLALLYQDRLAAANGAEGGARTASVVGNDLLSDYSILRATLREASGMASIDKVVVFHASGPTATIPSGCKTSPSASPSGACNVYTATDFARPASDFGCGSSSPDRYWCPSTRKVNLTTDNGGPPDYVGVWIQGRYEPVTGVIGPTVTIEQLAVLRIEPTKR